MPYTCVLGYLETDFMCTWFMLSQANHITCIPVLKGWQIKTKNPGHISHITFYIRYYHMIVTSFQSCMTYMTSLMQQCVCVCGCGCVRACVCLCVWCTNTRTMSLFVQISNRYKLMYKEVLQHRSHEEPDVPLLTADDIIATYSLTFPGAHAIVIWLRVLLCAHG